MHIKNSSILMSTNRARISGTPPVDRETCVRSRHVSDVPPTTHCCSSRRVHRRAMRQPARVWRWLTMAGEPEKKKGKSTRWRRKGQHFLVSPEARNFTLAKIDKLSDLQIIEHFAAARWGGGTT